MSEYVVFSPARRDWGFVSYLHSPWNTKISRNLNVNLRIYKIFDEKGALKKMSKSIAQKTMIKNCAYSLFYSPNIDIKGWFLELPALFVHLKQKIRRPKIDYSLLNFINSLLDTFYSKVWNLLPLFHKAFCWVVLIWKFKIVANFKSRGTKHSKLCYPNEFTSTFIDYKMNINVYPNHI